MTLRRRQLGGNEPTRGQEKQINMKGGDKEIPIATSAPVRSGASSLTPGFPQDSGCYYNNDALSSITDTIIFNITGQ